MNDVICHGLSSGVTFTHDFKFSNANYVCRHSILICIKIAVKVVTIWETVAASVSHSFVWLKIEF